MTKSNNWCVITGAPSTGKTTLINILKERGYTTIHDVARSLINESLSRGLSPKELRANDSQFQRNVLLKKAKIENSLNRDSLVFFDCGMHDAVAYLKLRQKRINKEIREVLREVKYKRVFLTQPLDFYEEDNVRIESRDDSLKLSELLVETYTSFGMKPIVIPSGTPKERADFVLSHIN